MHSLSRGRPLLALCLILGTLSQRCAASPADDLAVTGEIRGQDGAFDFAAVDPVLGALYVAREDGVMRVDLATRQATSTFVPGNKVHAVIPLPDGRLLSTNDETNTITLADARTGAVLATLPAGHNPDAAIRDPATVLRKIPTAIGARTGALDPRSGALYLPAADYSIGFGGITQKAGTFRILVVGVSHG